METKKQDSSQKVSGIEKISYVLANLGNIPIQALIGTYLLIFYTNVCGLNPAACATLFLVARILDGINDPLVGFLIDHVPNTKMGHFRPALMAGTVLCSANFAVLWFGPMMADSGKLFIAYISYLLIGVLFPIMDISLNSMLPVMTTDMKERNAMSSIKGVAYTLGYVGFTMAAPIILGETSNADGYVKLIVIAIVIVMAFSIVGALGMKERVLPQEGKRYGLKDLVHIIIQNPVGVTFLMNLCYMVGTNIVNAAIVLCVIVIPSVLYFIGAAIFAKFYPLTKEKLDEQNAILEKKRA